MTGTEQLKLSPFEKKVDKSKNQYNGQKTIDPTVGLLIHTGSMEVSAIKPKSLFSLFYLYKGIYKLLLLWNYSAIFENGSVNPGFITMTLDQASVSKRLTDNNTEVSESL